MDNDYTYIDEYGDEYEYDEFIGKMVRKFKAKRAANPKVIARKQKRAAKRVAKGKSPTHPIASIFSKKSKAAPIQPMPSKIATSVTGTPVTVEALKEHKIYNSAKQHELKTVQEEKKAEGLTKRVEQEDLKNKALRQKAGLFGAGKGLIGVVGGVLLIGVAFSIYKSQKTASV